MTFEQWMASVDAVVWEVVGVSVHDFADAPFADWFDDGIEPVEAAQLTIEGEGF
jgi:hypothetical protein